MTRIIPFEHPRRLREKIHAAACDWLVVLDIGASAEDRDALHAWLAEDPEHVEAFLELAALWDRMNVLSELAELFPSEQYLAGLRSSTRSKGTRRLRLIAACTLVAVLGAAAVGLNYVGRAGHLPFLLGPQTYQTAVGEQESIVLPDGSKAILNTNSLIQRRFSDEVRGITVLRGEVHFSVVEDSSRPFQVVANGSVVEAVGTAFSVRARPDALEVVVADGEVSLIRAEVDDRRNSIGASRSGETLRAPAGRLALLAGDRAVINNSTQSIRREHLQPQQIEVKLAWRHGMLLFQGDPLQEVLREVGRYTTTTIEADPRIHDVRVSGYFRAGDVEGLQVAMRENFGIVSRKVSADHILLVPQP